MEIRGRGRSRRSEDMYVLDDDVVVHYRDRVVQADHIEYDMGDRRDYRDGHLKATGRANNELSSPSHGAMNPRAQTGRSTTSSGRWGSSTGHRMAYASCNPFLFTGQVVVKTGPRKYRDLRRDGDLLPVAEIRTGYCRRRSSWWITTRPREQQHLPADEYSGAVSAVCHASGGCNGPADGILIPEIGVGDQGIRVGEQVYWAINRSTDLTVGSKYYSGAGRRRRPLSAIAAWEMTS